ncbi:MAG: CHASE3 domain-containing protein [Blastocatellales bacterium]
MRLNLEKYAPLAFLMGLALLIGLSVTSYRSLNNLTRTADRVAETERAIALLEETLSDFKDIVIGHRGYLLTGKELYLKFYYQAREDIYRDFDGLRLLTANNQQQRRKLNELERLKERSLKLSEEIVETRRQRGFNAALTLIERDSGQSLMEEIRRVIKEMEAEESRLLRMRETASRSSARRARIILVAGSSMGMLLTLLAIMAVRSELNRRKRAEAALRQSNIELERRVAERTSELSGLTRRLQFALDGARLGAWSVDLPSGRFWSDDTSKVMHGFEPGETINTLEEAGVNVHPDDQPVTTDRFLETLQNRTELEREYRVILPDGGERWVIASGQAIQSDASDPQSYKMFGIVQDITERKRDETDRERLLANEQAARQAAEEANRMKDEFLAVLSHELRTPLNAIIGYTNLMRAGKHKPEDAPRMLDIVLRNARTQQQLIADMLDVSRIITGKMGLSIGPVELKALIHRALDTVRPAAEAKQITLKAEFDSSVGVITGDANRLQQAVWNLLSNAVKFTPSGGEVTARLARSDSYVEIAVSDTGKGIKPEFLPHVFDRFSQEDYSITRRYGGLGLGLSIVRHIAELHGGTAKALSEGEGRGATFLIRLPVRAPQSVELQDRTSRETAASQPREKMELQLNGARVLVVDDDADTRQLLRRILEDYGATVRTAASAAEALEMIVAGPPDALVADIGMPDEDGYALMRKIRKLPSERGGGVPALALTAYARPEDRTRALTAGFQNFVTKPVEPDELAAVVASLTGS